MIAQLGRVMQVANTREVIENYYAYICVRDRTRWLALFDADVVLDEHHVGRVLGIRELSRVIAAVDATVPVLRVMPRHVVIAGEEACVIEDISIVTAQGVAIEHSGASYFRVADGKIIYFTNLRHSAPFPKPTLL